MALNWKLPSASVSASRVAAVVSEVSLTPTPGMRLPLLSATVPVIEPVTFWAKDSEQKANMPKRRLDGRRDTMKPPGLAVKLIMSYKGVQELRVKAEYLRLVVFADGVSLRQ